MRQSIENKAAVSREPLIAPMFNSKEPLDFFVQSASFAQGNLKYGGHQRKQFFQQI